MSRDRVEPRRAGCSYLRDSCYPSSTEYVLAQEARNTYVCGGHRLEDHSAVTTRSQFCPVTKAAEVFGTAGPRSSYGSCASAPGPSESCSKPHPLYHVRCWLSVSSNSSSLASCT